ncbi:serine/threonine-protein phosphatase 6 regulatory ankyrin repeat subunit B isoform X2 [Phlebotomus argentipes]|nr:serine/threonine-protein phosphatase 6 regulatory ankyrin repeat subunit B isoform X2 [Phlebotomus argentipes]XP_059615091.1 serine/threonine-protein phosphatase 6 regulatory ankyrin repeat subunit B isoform X2 [Phlebotomus argentipes]XP_059615092.1 serine/threonine-protein phosphatase 6 regulatory ankyrin repeat subunit B isoform X2 [Phlebotomus argentipes]
MNDSGNGNLLEIPLFRTEEGRYLATSLGDPLIKGLTEVANQRPENPVAFLASYLNNFVNKPASDEQQMIPAKSDTKESGAREVAGRSVIDHPVADAVPSTPSPDEEETTGAFDRDEHGQSMLHFACARSHGRNALFHLIEESGVSITFRDELYRTARDVALQASQASNAKELDRYVVALAARGDIDTFQAMLLDGYDHILDPRDAEGNSITSVAQARGHQELFKFLESIPDFEERREKCHNIIRDEDLERLQRFLDSSSDAIRLMKARNYYGRNALHIAVLKEKEDVVEYIVTNFRATIKLGDNLERTPLHYAMGVSAVEAISRILIKNGAKRVVKDLKGRQPSYYFMNKSDILRLQEEEHH